jgi:hypothetical protein
MTHSKDAQVKMIPPIRNVSDAPLDHLFASRPPAKGTSSLMLPLEEHESKLWREAIETATPEHPYISFCISSISKLYSLTTSFRGDPSLAYEDHITASYLFRCSQITVDEANWAAVLIFAVSLLIFQFASQQACLREHDYMETLCVLKTSAGVGTAVAPFLRRSKIWWFLSMRNDLAWRHPDAEMWEALSRLRTAVTSTDAQDVQEREIVGSAVQALMDWARLCNGSPRTWKEYVMFPGAVPAEYLQLLDRGDDRALLILIFWCAIMRLGTKRWFLETWLTRTSDLASSRLTNNWSKVLEWPDAVMGSKRIVSDGA